MKKQVLFSIVAVMLLAINVPLSAQVSVNSDGALPNNSAMLDVKSSSKGLLVPRMTQNQIALISDPANGLIVFCITDNKFYAYVAIDNAWKELLYGSGTIILINVPLVTTAAVTVISSTTASSGGNVISDGGTPVTARGVCWSTISNPTVNDSHTNEGNGTGVFTSALTLLDPNTVYFLRAYATNSYGTSYGSEMMFNTTYYVGANYGGGIIFYLDGTSQHGLIDLGYNFGSSPVGAQWDYNPTYDVGTSTAFGAGQANTMAIVNLLGEQGRAAYICDTTNINGYSDWFLPSKDELNQLYLYHLSIGFGSMSNYCWSSSEYNSYEVWIQDINFGNQYNGPKYEYQYVRPIRAF